MADAGGGGSRAAATWLLAVSCGLARVDLGRRTTGGMRWRVGGVMRPPQGGKIQQNLDRHAAADVLIQVLLDLALLLAVGPVRPAPSPLKLRPVPPTRKRGTTSTDYQYLMLLLATHPEKRKQR